VEAAEKKMRERRRNNMLAVQESRYYSSGVVYVCIICLNVFRYALSLSVGIRQEQERLRWDNYLKDYRFTQRGESERIPGMCLGLRQIIYLGVQR